MKKSLPVLLLFAVAAWFIFVLAEYWEVFLATCPNKDVLSWDANLRFMTALDYYQDVSRHRWASLLVELIRSPTWPPNRSLMTLFTFYFNNPERMASNDILIGLGFFFLLLPSLIYMSLRTLGLSFWATIPLLFTLTGLIHAKELPAYALSAMLETQGMFFFLWVCYGIYRLYSPSTIPKRDLWLWFVASQGLFLTKYPYAVMLYLAIAATELLYYRKQLGGAVSFLLSRYLGWRLIPIVGLVISVGMLLFGREIVSELSPKVFKQIVFVLSLILFVDFNLIVYRFRDAFREHVAPRTRIIYLYGLFPSLVWLFLSSDRFGSILGTQMVVQEETSSFFLSFPSIFDHWVYAAAFVLLLATTLVTLWRNRNNQILAVIGIIFFHFLTLDFLTANRQLRHIYHLLPAMLFFVSIGALLLSSLRVRLFSSVLILGVTFLFVIADRNNEVITGGADAQYCFTGKDKDAFSLPRKLASRIKPTGNLVILNQLHQSLASPENRMATEIDLLIKQKYVAAGFECREYSKHKSLDIANPDLLVVTRGNCITANQVKDVHLSDSDTFILEETIREGMVCLTRLRTSGL